jgi:hypothetical protein
MLKNIFQPTRQGLLALVAIAVMFAAFLLRGAPLELDAVRAANAPDQFDATRAIGRLQRVIGDGKPHPVDSDQLDVVRTRLIAEITSLGYTPTTHTSDACRSTANASVTRCARVTNVVFYAGPPVGNALVLTAHYDSVDISPGAGDDGIGVAVWLEVAQLVLREAPKRPVVFLFTDGEEAMLLGAQAFEEANGYGFAVDRIINLEARGNRGPSLMFETSNPNADVVGDWAAHAVRPASNSLMTAVYKQLPNSTDLTVHLNSGREGVNFAVGDGFAFYHTERDSIAELDPRSVQHMGDNALAATRAYLTSETVIPGDIVYTDILTRFFVSLPQVVGLMLLGLCLGGAAMLMFRPTKDADWKKFDWRAFGAPPAAIAASGVLAWLLPAVIGAIRPEPAFWTAHPWAMHAAIFLASATATLAATGWIARGSTRERLFAVGWFWFLVVGVALCFAIPGIAMVFLVPGIGFVLAAGAGWVWPKYRLIAQAVATAICFAVFLPLIQLFDVMMGLALAPLFGVLAGLILAPASGLIGPITERRISPVVITAAAMLAALVASTTLPAYTKQTPLSLDVFAHYDMDARVAKAGASVPPGALPPALRREFSGQAGPLIPGLGRMVPRDIAFAERPSASLAVASDSAGSGTRTLTLNMSAPGARFIRMRIPEAVKPVSLTYLPAPTMRRNDDPDATTPATVSGYEAMKPVPLKAPLNGFFVFDCLGRQCDGGSVQVVMAADAPTSDWTIQGLWSGLPDDAAALAALRPDTTVQIATGDATITTRAVKLPAAAAQ